jgi:hypothetical protein
MIKVVAACMGVPSLNEQDWSFNSLAVIGWAINIAGG